MNRIFACLIATLLALLLVSPAWAGDRADTGAANPALGALLNSAKLDLPTLLLASQVLQLLQDDQAGFNLLLAELTASGDLTEAGAAKLTGWLESSSADYLTLLAPTGSVVANTSGFIGPQQLEQPQVGEELSDPITELGIELSADGTVQVQGVEQLLGLAGLGDVAEAASTAGVVLELDPENVGVYIPLTVNGTVVSAGQMQFDGVSSELESLLHRLTPEARVYTVPKAWREDAGAAWNYLCELVTGKERERSEGKGDTGSED